MTVDGGIFEHTLTVSLFCYDEFLENPMTTARLFVSITVYHLTIKIADT